MARADDFKIERSANESGGLGSLSAGLARPLDGSGGTAAGSQLAVLSWAAHRPAIMSDSSLVAEPNHPGRLDSSAAHFLDRHSPVFLVGSVPPRSRRWRRARYLPGCGGGQRSRVGEFALRVDDAAGAEHARCDSAGGVVLFFSLWLIPTTILQQTATGRIALFVQFGPFLLLILATAGVSTYYAIYQLQMVGKIHGFAEQIDLFQPTPLYAFSGLRRARA